MLFSYQDAKSRICYDFLLFVKLSESGEYPQDGCTGRNIGRRGRGRFIVPLSFVSPVFHYLNYGSNSVRVQKVHTTSNLALPSERDQKTRLRRLSRNNFYVRNGAGRARRFLLEKWQASLENSDKKATLFYSHQCFPRRTLACTFVGRHGTPRAISVGDHSKFFSPAALDGTST